MFSANIQKLISSSSQTSAMKRAAELEVMIEQKTKDVQALERELVLAMEEDNGVEICQVGNDESGELVFRFKEKNILNMAVGIVPYDSKNEIHVAYATVRKSLKDLAEELCK